MNEHEQNELWERSLRDQLTPGEQAKLEAWLALRPDLSAQWEEEKALCQLMRQLPDAPISSNFTSQVLQAVALEERAAQHERAEAPVTGGFMVWLRHHLVQLTASTAVVALATVLALQQVPTTNTVTPADSRQEIADQIKVLAEAPVPSVDVLKDYEAIRRLSQVSAEPDLELLAALQ
jgi:hypothetical protein